MVKDEPRFVQCGDEMRKSGRFSDFTIVCDGEEFKVHKFILARSSEYFSRLFAHEYKETIEHSIELHGESVDRVRLMLQHMYENKYSVPSYDEDKYDHYSIAEFSTHADMSSLASKYCMPDLARYSATRFVNAVARAFISFPRPAIDELDNTLTEVSFSANELMFVGLAKVWVNDRSFIREALSKNRMQEFLQNHRELAAQIAIEEYTR